MLFLKDLTAKTMLIENLELPKEQFLKDVPIDDLEDVADVLRN